MESVTAGFISANRKNLHKVLGVQQSCTENDIKRAYRRLALKFHPDKFNADMPHTELEHSEAFRIICRAQEILLDENKRRMYELGGMDDVDKFESRGEMAMPSLKEVIQMISFMCLVFATREGFRNVRRVNNPHPDGDVPLGDAESRRRARSSLPGERQFSYSHVSKVFRSTQLVLLMSALLVSVCSFGAFVMREYDATGTIGGCLVNVALSPIFGSDTEGVLRNRRIQDMARAVRTALPMAQGGMNCGGPAEIFSLYTAEEAMWMVGRSPQFDWDRNSIAFTSALSHSPVGSDEAISLLRVPACGYIVGPFTSDEGIPFYTKTDGGNASAVGVLIEEARVRWVGQAFCDGFETPLLRGVANRASPEQYGRRWGAAQKVCANQECRRLVRRPIRLRLIPPTVESPELWGERSPFCEWWDGASRGTK